LQPALLGDMDAFVSKLSPNGAALVYSTYLGGSRSDGVDYQYVIAPSFYVVQSSMGITVDPTGAAYVTGQTKSSDFPTTTSLQARCSGGPSDAFVVKITEDGLANSPAGDSPAGPPTNESMSNSRGGGGGTMDALFLVLLAQVAFAAALRRRRGPGL